MALHPMGAEPKGRERASDQRQHVIPYMRFGGSRLSNIADPAGRGRPPKAAARRAGLEFVEKLLTTNLTSTDTRSGTRGMPLLVPLVASWSSG
jgi:hypothetical protein